jgi:hypothetical protein
MVRRHHSPTQMVTTRCLDDVTAQTVPHLRCLDGHCSVHSDGVAVDDESVLHVTGHGLVVGLVYLVGRDGLDVAHDVLAAAEVQHLLRLPDAADQRPAQLWVS